jgi:hypothetical protein
MRHFLLSAVFAQACTTGARALPVPVIGTDNLLSDVADGCGPGAWRGLWGHCRNTPYYSLMPGDGYKAALGGNGCPAGYWRGPWGHCRNIPYHGRLPNETWK